MDRPPPILIAEDEPITRVLLKKTLVKAGYDVTAVDNGHKALELFKEKYFPIVFTDWVMPEMNGLDLCRAIRRSPTPGYVFIVILTGKDSPSNIITGLEAGADDYLTKPFQPSELIARLRTARRILELERALQKSNEGRRDQVEFLERFIDTIPNPTFYKDTHGVFRACNSAFAQQIVGKMHADIIGLSMDTLPGLPKGLDISGKKENGPVREQDRQVHETRIKCADNVVRDFLFSQSIFRDPAGKPSGIVGTLSDMTEKNNLLAKQELNIGLAKQVLNAVNGTSPRYIRLCGDLVLFVDAISVPCQAAGGDHYFVHNLGVNGNGGRGKTVLSLKDQSGHEVSCILRSIHTDLAHHLIFRHNDAMGPESAVSRLNDEICRSGVFDRDDFFTAINAELDHETLVLKYVSAGHPPFLLIRGNEVMGLPKPEDPGSNLPVAIQEGIAYSAGECQLKEKDKLIFYTDGLTEMPFKNHNKCIGNEELKNSFQGLNLSFVKEVVLDFGKVNHIGSAGIGKLLLLYKDLATAGGNIRIENLPGALSELFRELKLHTIFTITKA